MPKKIHRLVNFEGGVNESSDPRDVETNEVIQSDNVVVDELGKLKLIGEVSSTAITTFSSQSIEPGFGLFSYSTDRDNAGNLNHTDWITMLNVADGNVDLRHTTSGSSAVITDKLDLGGNNDNVRGSFYFADGVLRGTDSNFAAARNANTQWYGYTDSKLFHTTDRDTNNGTAVHEISRWTGTDASLKKLTDMGTPVTFELYDAGATNPSATQITNRKNRIVLAYWKFDNGDWNGDYQFGFTPVYVGDQEGPMDIHETQTITCADHKVLFQVYVQNADSATVSAGDAHILGDDRIIGINIYFRPYGEKTFRLLKSIDLKEGGQNHWKAYNSTDHTAHGVFAGTVTLAQPVQTSGSGTNSYKEATATVTINNTNYSNGFDDRKGILRLWGFNASPEYHDVKVELDVQDGSSSGTNFPISVVLPSAGTHEFRAELLDEDFNVVAESAPIETTIADSGLISTDSDRFDYDSEYGAYADREDEETWYNI